MSERPNIIRSLKRPCEVEHCKNTGDDGRADEGDVRRCRHGKLWVATGRRTTGYYYNTLSVWRELHPFWNWREYRIAVKALDRAALGVPVQEETP